MTYLKYKYILHICYAPYKVNKIKYFLLEHMVIGILLIKKYKLNKRR